ncbi:tetratricopeptide repeat protein [Flavobacteriaceae bacterium]|nr:tetratricopeptide repeat protein [Flavobacteriaceae bacterium]
MNRLIALLLLTSFSPVNSQEIIEESAKFLYFGKQGLKNAADGNHAKAILDFNHALEIFPDNTNALFSRGNSLLRMSRFEEAIADFSKVVEINPEHEDAFFNRGFAFKAIEKYREAIQDFSMVIKMNPTDGKSYYFRGVIFGVVGENKLACMDIKMANTLGEKIQPSILQLCN